MCPNLQRPRRLTYAKETTLGKGYMIEPEIGVLLAFFGPVLVLRAKN